MKEIYEPNKDRYEKMQYRRVGESGLLLPAVSLGLWHNFGSVDSYENARSMVQTAFNLGITHFDLANNYGPEPGSAEVNFGRILAQDLGGFRDELIISSKAGYHMWDGPYGEGGSRKYLIASLDQSLKRMGLDYVDIFYSHRPDPDTPLSETIGALDQIVRSGKALYVGISSYTTEQTQAAADEAAKLGLKLLIHQPNYSMFDRWIEEEGLQDTLDKNGMGSIAFAPLAQGMLTTKYINGIPTDSRIGREGEGGSLSESAITDKKLGQIKALNEIAKSRGQTLAQMALAWNLRGGRLTSVLIGASKPQQIIENVAALDNLEFTSQELAAIDKILAEDKELGSNNWHKKAMGQYVS